jgi:oligosaccharide repeat unit polymerase
VITTYFLANEQRTKRLWEFVLYSTLFVGILGGLTYLVIQTRGVGRILDVEEYIIKTGYLYVTGGVSAFDQFLLDDFNYAYGQSSLRSFFKWLARVGIWPDDNLFVVHEPFIKVTPSIEINTYTYAKSFFEDFGIYGVLVGSFIYAAITKLIMVHSLKRFSFFYIMLAVTMIFSLLMTFYSFYFHSVTTIIYRLLVVLAIQYVLSKKLIR